MQLRLEQISHITIRALVCLNWLVDSIRNEQIGRIILTVSFSVEILLGNSFEYFGLGVD